VPDAIFSHPRLAAVYDALDPDRSDLDVYVAIAEEFGATTALDVGCGTGTFACMLARRGIEVVAVEPASASLDIARGKPHGERVRWILGDATTLPAMSVEMAFMTANVAQVFLTDDDWSATLQGIHGALRPDGLLVFESRDPARRAWERWTPELTRVRADVPEVGVVESWTQLLDADGERVTFRTLTRFSSDGAELESTSTLRFRTQAALEQSLTAAGYQVIEVRDAPDRPGREFVFIARTDTSAAGSV
jgi:SAM-dependent methyltransferase